jgi:Ni,Fe-hydrogenase III component G
MALFIDIHKHIPGLTKEAIKGAHAKDLEIQKKYKVKFLKYWYDDKNGKAFCLVEAPDKESAIAVHREGHGLVADEIVEVHEGE